MSRIHEALKKAGQDYGDLTAVPDESGLKEAALGAEKPPRNTGESSSESSRFESLIKRCSKAEWRPDLGTSIFANSEKERHEGEEFRALRSRLYQLRSTRKIRSLLVTSALPGEGKTFIAVNLALIIARQPDSKVLLLDADMRCSQLHFALGAPGSPGLTEYLREQAYLENVVQHGNQGNLCFIPAGNAVPTPGELVAGPRMKSLLQLVYPTFDWIIIDSPAVLAVSDPLVLADLVDGVLQVVAAASTDREHAQKACREFQDKNFLGVVLNRGKEGRF